MVCRAPHQSSEQPQTQSDEDEDEDELPAEQTENPFHTYINGLLMATIKHTITPEGSLRWTAYEDQLEIIKGCEPKGHVVSLTKQRESFQLIFRRPRVSLCLSAR